MTTPILPVDGQTPWGDELNIGILQVNTNAGNAQTSISNHSSNIPADPHADRAYAQSLVSPITTGVNGPNGYVKTNSQGAIPGNLITALGGAGGMYTDIFDAVATYGMATGGGDASVACQNACNAAAAVGGGIVWIGPGTFSFANYVVIPSNVWILMSEGTLISRKSTGVAPPYIFTNIKFGTNNTPSSGVRITGGKLDAVGTQGLVTACIPIYMLQSQHTIIEDCRIFNPFNSVGIELNGCTSAFVKGVKFDGTNNVSGPIATKPAIRLNITNTATTPAGLLNTLYNQSVCSSISIVGCMVLNSLAGEFGPYGSLVASDLVALGQNTHNGINVTGCQMLYNGNPSINSNGVWSFYSVIGNVLAEANAANGGWNALIGSSGFGASNLGVQCQWRYVNTGINGSGLNLNTSVYTSADAIEIVGDALTGSSVSNGTNVFSFPGLPTGLFNSGHIIPVTFPSIAPPTGARLFFTGTTLQCQGMSSLNGQRFTFHDTISMSA